MSSSDINCNNTSPPLTNIIRFDSLRIVVRFMILKRSIREKFPHLYKKCFVPSPTDISSSQERRCFSANHVLLSQIMFIAISIFYHAAFCLEMRTLRIVDPFPQYLFHEQWIICIQNVDGVAIVSTYLVMSSCYPLKLVFPIFTITETCTFYKPQEQVVSTKYFNRN